MTAPAPTSPTQTSFLDPSVLARIGNLELLAKVVVEGFINGLHKSPHLGASTDFAEHRAYMPGVDIRIDDMRVTVFHPNDESMPEVLVQNEVQAREWERLNPSGTRIKASK